MFANLIPPSITHHGAASGWRRCLERLVDDACQFPAHWSTLPTTSTTRHSGPSLRTPIAFLTKFVFVALLCVLFSGCRNQVSPQKAPFSFHGMEGWSIRPKDRDGTYETYQLQRGSTTFDITVNPRNRDLIACFCAPMDSYKVTHHGNSTSYELRMESPDGASSCFTMKVQGPTSSLDVHYQTNHPDEDFMTMIILLRSLRTASPSPALAQAP